jgi:S-ribosylhomocysteine lyase
MSKEKLPESASLDHTRVKAPYVRLAGVVKTKHGDKIYKYDVRFIQPNSDAIPNAILHSLEHLLAVNMRIYLNGVLDISPMGCQTGFYILALHPYDEVVECLEKSLKELLKAKKIPFANIVQCGAASNHDLKGAKKYARLMLKGINNWETGGSAYMNLTAHIELH